MIKYYLITNHKVELVIPLAFGSPSEDTYHYSLNHKQKKERVSGRGRPTSIAVIATVTVTAASVPDTATETASRIKL